jgi:hypothetical protein
MIIFAETHLSARIWRARPEVAGDAAHAMTSLMSLALVRSSLRCDKDNAFVYVGDAFDSARPDPADLQFAMFFNEKLKAAGFQIAHIQGDHDRRPDEPTWLELCGSRRLGPRSADIGGMGMVGIDRCSGDEFAEAVTAAEAADVLVAHHPLTPINNFEKCGIQPGDLPAGKFKFAVFGHTHRFWTWGGAGGLQVCSTGATHRREFAEPAGTAAELGGGAFVELPLHGRPMREFKAPTELEAMEKWLAELPPHPLPPAIRLSVEPWAELDKAYIDSLRPRCHIVIAPRGLAPREPGRPSTVSVDPLDLLPDDPRLRDILSGALTRGVVFIEEMERRFEEERGAVV